MNKYKQRGVLFMKWFLRNEKRNRILFLGSDILENCDLTEKIKYYFDNYCPERKIEIIKNSKKGESLGEAAEINIFERLQDVISKAKPNTVVFLYGENDGAYSAFSLKKFTAFKNGVQKLIEILSSENIKIAAMTLPSSAEESGASEKRYSKYITNLDGDERIEAIIDLDNAFFQKNFTDIFKSENTFSSEASDIAARAVLKELFNISLSYPIGNFPDETYHGFERKNFYFRGREASFIFPKKWSKEKRWIWRAEFLGAFDSADRAMLEKGWGLAYININDMYGCNEAIEIMNAFHKEIVKMFELHKKCVLFGFSRGGLYSVNYAYHYPKLVAGLYLDAPVVDIYSWPGGFGCGISNFKSREWQECRILFGVSDKKKNSYKDTLPEKFDVLLKNDIPVMYVAGGSDSVVPYLENGIYLVDTYLKNSGRIKIYIESWRDHHPHSLEEPAEIVRFILSDM